MGRYKMEMNRVLAGNWIMIEGIDQPTVKTSIISDMQSEEEPYVERVYYMQNEELCVKKPFNIYTGVMKTNIKRTCLEVSEFMGDLVEVINDVTGTDSEEPNCKRDKSTNNDGHEQKVVVCDRK